MHLPNRVYAFVPKEKLTRYLLSETHDFGKSKARYFRAHGFNEGNLRLLEQGLLSVAQNNVVTKQESSSHGTKYLIRGKIETPTGISVTINTVWIIEAGDHKPRLVTAYPF